MRIGSSRILREIDKYCIEKLRIPSLVLMENAALKVIKNLKTESNDSYVIVCGRGNNGGDGLAVARHLFVQGTQIDVFIIGDSSKMSEDCAANYNILNNMGVKINVINNIEDLNYLREAISKCSITIDALFGTGLSRRLEGIFDLVITIVNENSSKIVSIDVPSGFESDTGEILGNCIHASETISFVMYKEGFIHYGTDKLCGKIIIEDIGIPEYVLDKFHQGEFLMDNNIIKKYFIKRDKYSHKGDFGRVMVIAGSEGYTGAAYISTSAAIKAGAGLVTLCCPKDIQNILEAKLIESMTISLEDEQRLNEHILKSDCIAVGPGMGCNEGTINIVKKVIENCDCPVVIDADGINVLQDNISLLSKCRNKIILTPHLGEMSKLTGLTIEDIKKNRINIAKEFASKHQVIVLLKGYNTVITDGESVFINSTGNSAMASGGMGDSLTGLIASFIGQGYDPLKATLISTYIHGYCGDKLSEKMFSVSASDLIQMLPYCIKEFV